ncbi:MAG: cell division protein ZapE [Steroidobacteraceae bacterium]
MSEPAPRAGISASLRQLYEQQVRARGFTADAAQLAAVARLDELRSQLANVAAAPRTPLPRWLSALAGRAPPAPRGLYLWGSVGRGKTWLMDLFFDSLPTAQRRRRHFHRFMHDVHTDLTRLKQRRAPLAAVAANLARDTRVLCLDELYVSDIADAMILGGLFAGLVHRGVTLVITSNTPPGELYRDGLQRERFLPAIQLLERNLAVLRLDGATDHRLRRLTQAGTWLAAGAPDTAARLLRLFTALADHRGHAGGVIDINGRDIPVVHSGGGAVWFEFTALCAGPRSQEDYIEIARDYQSVILAGVPVMGAARDDEARRFIALIDEFYDHNVNLIVSAQAPVTGLYQGERLREAFARTTSRLIEMQSADYLAREHRA